MSSKTQPRTAMMLIVLCQKGLRDIFCHFVLFMDYDTTANNTSPVKFLEASCAWK